MTCRRTKGLTAGCPAGRPGTAGGYWKSKEKGRRKGDSPGEGESLEGREKLEKPLNGFGDTLVRKFSKDPT